MDLFEQLKEIPASDAAIQCGISLKQKGNKQWACCPLHGEKTESMCFYPNGSWYCYGCHKGGDSVTLYQEMYNEDAVDAAKHLAADFGLSIDETSRPKGPSPRLVRYRLQQALEAWRSRQYDKFCRILFTAKAIINQPRSPEDETDPWEDERFCAAIKAREVADFALDILADADTEELAEMYREEAEHGQPTGTGSDAAGVTSPAGPGG